MNVSFKGALKNVEFSAILEKLGYLRTRLESEVTRPAVIAITSAQQRDGKSLVAFGLAHNLAEAGHRVLFVDANQGASGLATGSIGTAPKLSKHPDYDILSYATECADSTPDMLDLTSPGVLSSCSVDAARATFSRFRNRYDFTVVDTSVLTGSNVALSFVSLADGVLVAVRQGRSACQADRDVSSDLKAAHAAVLGVVTVDNKAIKAFAAQRPYEVRVRAPQIRRHDDYRTGAPVRIPSN